MKKCCLPLLLGLLFLAISCKKESLPPTEFVMVKFENKTGKDIENLSVSRVFIGALKNGKKTEYLEYEALGQQYGFALVEASADLNGERYFTASACSGVCGTASAPDGEWLEAGYHHIVIRISDERGGNYLEFLMK